MENNHIFNVFVCIFSPVAEKETVDPLVMFHQALENAKPLIGTIGIKKGGRTYQVSIIMFVYTNNY